MKIVPCFPPARAWHARMVRPCAPVLALVLTLAACHGNAEDAGGEGDQGVEDLTIMVESDKSRILEQEQNLKEKRESVDQERQRLALERADVEQKLASLSKKDRKQRDELEAQEQRLRDEEKRIQERTRAFEAERAKLEADKTRLLERLSQATQPKGGLTIEQREEIVAKREKDVARREAKVVEREKEVANVQDQATAALQEIQRILAALQQGGGLTRAAGPTTSSAASGSGGGATRQQVHRLQRQVNRMMDIKGISPADLPPAGRELDGTAKSSIAANDYDSASQALGKLQDMVRGLKVDYAFVQGKFARMARLYDSKKQGLEEKRRKRVEALLADVSESVTDGRYDRANKKINQLSALLEGGD